MTIVGIVPTKKGVKLLNNGLNWEKLRQQDPHGNYNIHSKNGIGGNKKMVDITKATESKFITVKQIEESPTKILIILPGAKFKDGNFGEKLEFNVSLDAKEKIWSPSVASAKNMFDAWGSESDNFIGKKMYCSIDGNKIIAVPLKEKENDVVKTMTDAEIAADLEQKEEIIKTHPTPGSE